MQDLNKIEQEVDQLLATETRESLYDWFMKYKETLQKPMSIIHKSKIKSILTMATNKPYLEILDGFTSGYSRADFGLPGNETKEFVDKSKASMAAKQYAKQEAIAFANWLSGLTSEDIGNKNTKELFQKYIDEVGQLL